MTPRITTPLPIDRFDGADGQPHDVLVATNEVGRWVVLDRAPSRTTIIEILRGWDDHLASAQALARDFADQQRRYLCGEREDAPIPRAAIALDDF